MGLSCKFSLKPIHWDEAQNPQHIKKWWIYQKKSRNHWLIESKEKTKIQDKKTQQEFDFNQASQILTTNDWIATWIYTWDPDIFDFFTRKRNCILVQKIGFGEILTMRKT